MLRCAVRKRALAAQSGTVVSACLAVMYLSGIRINHSAGKPAAPPAPRSWLAHASLVTVYGRGFGVAPVLGRLGLDHSFADAARQVGEYAPQIRQASGQPTVRRAVHLIYAMAEPCVAGSTCLLYLDDLGVNIVKRYIEPAARRGWLVILDDQLGRSNPASEVERMIARGYLRYDNVEVAFDPEFRMAPSQQQPGVPLGHVSATDLNTAASLINRTSRIHTLRHRKLLLVHEYAPGMVTNQSALQTRLPYVQPVLAMDGIGTPLDKTQIYRDLFRSSRAAGVLTGIKLFLPSPYTGSVPVDTPSLTWGQVFGRLPVMGSAGRAVYLTPQPRVVILT